jgi:hypothetical protein
MLDVKTAMRLCAHTHPPQLVCELDGARDRRVIVGGKHGHIRGLVVTIALTAAVSVRQRDRIIVNARIQQKAAQRVAGAFAEKVGSARLNVDRANLNVKVGGEDGQLVK